MRLFKSVESKKGGAASAPLLSPVSRKKHLCRLSYDNLELAISNFHYVYALVESVDAACGACR